MCYYICLSGKDRFVQKNCQTQLFSCKDTN
uniref:Uncharacterized protein n=1 Tax=Anguilla anguilla TaxID=7936 RepID=A0A0E9V6I5_ANGAN